MLDEVINMLAAVRDAAAADTYSALLPSNGADNASSTEVSVSQHHPSAVKNTDHIHQQQRQKQQKHRRPLPRPASVASIDLRDPGEL